MTYQFDENRKIIIPEQPKTVEEGISAVEKIIQNIFDVPEKKKKPIKQLFIKFLKKEEVIERYKRNWLFCDWYSHERPIKKTYRYISYAFLWTSSPEGHDFWRQIDNKWLEYLESIGR